MDFSKFENPKAANDFLKRSKKVSQRKTLCAANFLGNCNGIIDAHTLSKKSMLEPVANSKNEVYTTPTISLVKHQINLEKKGISGVSTFRGFCGMHDKDLFTCLDDDEFKCTPKQLFMLAYRTISKELYKKINFPERLPTKEEYISMVGRHKSNKYILFIKKIKKHNKYSIQSLEYIKNKLDIQLKNEDWSLLKSHVLFFENLSHPICAATGAFQPLFDISGKIINQPFDCYDEYGKHLGKGLKLRTIIFSIIPVKDMYVVIFSWDNDDDVSENFFKSILKQENKSLAAFNTMLDNIENFAIYPEWYEKLDTKKKNFIRKRIRNEIKNAIWENPEKYNSMLDTDEFKEIINWKFLELRTKLINLKINIMRMCSKLRKRSMGHV